METVVASLDIARTVERHATAEAEVLRAQNDTEQACLPVLLVPCIVHVLYQYNCPIDTVVLSLQLLYLRTVHQPGAPALLMDPSPAQRARHMDWPQLCLGAP